MITAGRWRELWAFEQANPAHFRRLVPHWKGPLGRLPVAAVLDLPHRSQLRQYTVASCAEAILQGDYTAWVTQESHPALRDALLEHRADRTFLVLCQHKSQGKHPPSDLWELAQKRLLSDPAFWFIAPHGLTHDGHINRRHGAPDTLNVLDACCRYDNPVMLRELLRLTPKEWVWEYPMDPRTLADMPTAGFGLVDSLLERGADVCLAAFQAEDPTFLFRPRHFGRQGASEPQVRHPLDDLLDCSVAGHLSHLPSTQDKHRLSALGAFAQHLKTWGDAVLPEEDQTAWTALMTPVLQSHGADWGEHFRHAVRWLRDQSSVEPVACASLALHGQPKPFVDPAVGRRSRLR